VNRRGYDRAARTQGVGPFPRTSEATEHRDPCARKNEQAPAETAEVVEGRELAKGNSGQHNRVRTQGRAARSRARDRVRQAAREGTIRVTARWHQVEAIDRRRAAYDSLNCDAAPGVEGPTWAAYGEHLDTNLRDVSDRRTRGA